jgi:hypothetical protein
MSQGASRSVAKEWPPLWGPLSRVCGFAASLRGLDCCLQPEVPKSFMDETSVPAGLSDAAEWLFAFAAIVLLGCHLWLKNSHRWKGLRLLTALVLLSASLVVIGLVSARPLVRFSTIITCVFVYAVSLFVAVSEILTFFGGGAALTRWRGENWGKELDYVYFALGGSVRSSLSIE